MLGRPLSSLGQHYPVTFYVQAGFSCQSHTQVTLLTLKSSGPGWKANPAKPRLHIIDPAAFSLLAELTISRPHVFHRALTTIAKLIFWTVYV